MGISFNDEHIAEKDGARVVIPRDANFDPFAILGGFDSTNTFKFAQFTTEGKLKVDASISAEGIDIGDVNIRVQGTTGADIRVGGDVIAGTTLGYIWTEDPRMGFTSGALQVSISGATASGIATETTQLQILQALGGGSPDEMISRVGATGIAPNELTPTTIIDYEVPTNSRFRIDTVRGWGDVDAEFFVFIDTLQVDGWRTTPANLTMNIESPAIQYATVGQHVIVAAKHWVDRAGTQVIKASLQGALETI